MKKGDIIRKRLFGFNGRAQISIGQYIQITDINKTQVFGRYLGSNDEFVISPTRQKNSIVMHVAYLAIDKETYEKICKYCNSVQHVCNKQYDNFIDSMHENGIDVICFYNKKSKVYCTFDGVKKIIIHRDFELVPYIRIYLRNVIAIERDK